MITFGFYNSMNGDRKYDAVQLSSVFDGLITDGVFATIGTAFAVTAGEGRTVNVGTGKAWFNHTWTVNDAVLPIEAPMSEILMDRIDAVVLEIDASEAIRANGIKIIQGTPGTSPAKPAMAEESTLHQYPFCYIYRKAGSTEIDQADIENAVGASACPFVTGILKTINVDNLLAQWNAQFGNWFTASKNLFSQEMDRWDASFSGWFDESKAEFSQEMTGWNGAFNTWFEESKSQFSEELVKWDEEFDDWFNNVKTQLSGDVAANLQNQITTLGDNLTSHIENDGIHVTEAQKNEWDGKAPGSLATTVSGHTSNGDIHVTAADKTKWNGYQTVHTLGYSKSGTQHRLTGLTGLYGTLSCVFKATAAFAAGDTFTVDGVAYTVQLSNGEAAEANLFVSGATVPVVIDTAGKKVNFKAGGGLSNSKLALATATAADVLSGKTFYSGNKTLKTGTMATPYKMKTGTVYIETTSHSTNIQIYCGFKANYVMTWAAPKYGWGSMSYSNGDGIAVIEAGQNSESSSYFSNNCVKPSDTGFIITNTYYLFGYGMKGDLNYTAFGI